MTSFNWLWQIPLTLILLYLLLVGLVYLRQPQMLYLPDMPGRALEADPESVGLEFENVRLNTSDGVQLHGWYIKHPQPRAQLLFFHGNAGNISHRLDSISLFYQLGLSVLIIDYRGYGQSEGSPTEQGTYLDAETAWNYLVSRQTAPNEILLFGRSLGAAMAAQLASQKPAGAVIIESAFASVPDVAAVHYPWLPVRLLSRFDYPTANFLSQARMPAMVIHSKDDEIAPFAQGETIFQQAREPKTFLALRGNHNEAIYISRAQYIDGLTKFLDHHFPDK